MPGNALVDKQGTPTLIYHGVGIGNCMATALDDRLISWQKLMMVTRKDTKAPSSPFFFFIFFFLLLLPHGLIQKGGILGDVLEPPDVA